MELKAYIWLDFNDVAIAEEMAHSLSTDDSNAYIVNIGAVSRFQIFAVDQRWEVMQLVFLVDD